MADNKDIDFLFGGDDSSARRLALAPEQQQQQQQGAAHVAASTGEAEHAAAHAAGVSTQQYLENFHNDCDGDSLGVRTQVHSGQCFHWKFNE